MKKLVVLVALVAGMALFVASAAFAGERVMQVRTVEDPRVIVRDEVCAEAPFTSNVRLGAYAWSFQTRASDGSVVNNMINASARPRPASGSRTSSSRRSAPPSFTSSSPSDRRSMPEPASAR